MPNVNLTDSRSRDAVVKAEAVGVDEEVRYVDDEKKSAHTRKVLKATVAHDFETLVKQHEGDAEALGKALVESDPEVDMEICGLYLWGVSKVYVDSSDGIVYRIEQQEIVRGPDGSVREKRPRNQPEANVDSEIPLTWTGRKFNKDEAVRRFVFASKLQIVHINGLTYDFLYGMAKELSDANVLMMVGGGSKGRDPLVFRRGSVPYRGFLEGRVDGDKYLLLLHLSNLELKAPAVDEKSDNKETAEGGRKDSKKKAAKKKVSPAAAVKEKSSDDAEEVVAEKKEKKVKAKKTASKDTSAKSDSKKKKPAKSKAAEVDSSSDGSSDTEKSNKPSAIEHEQSTARKEADSVRELEAEKVKEDKAGSAATITSEDLGIWLKGIRMGKYLKLFVEHEIDVDVLAELTDDDLKELDIPLGSRRRLLKAVEETDNLHAEVASAVKQMTASQKATDNKAAGKNSAGKAAKQKK